MKILINTYNSKIGLNHDSKINLAKD